MATYPAPTTQAPANDREEDIIRAVGDFYREAADAKSWRLARNEDNRNAFLGQQDFSYKVPGQSMEYLPKTGVAVQQFAAFFKRALTQAGPDWFEIVPPAGAVLDGWQCKALMTMFFDDCLLEDNVRGPIHVALSDAAILASTESLAILKIHGNLVDERRVMAGGPARGKIWKLRVDVIPFENYFPDPSGKGLYEIHEMERDLWEIEARAEEGLYDKAVVAKLRESHRIDVEGDREDDGRNQSESSPPSRRKKVVVREFWGTLLDSDGHVLMANCVCAVANDEFLIRPPAPNPFWHGESPFVAAPILRVPKGVHHKALFDEAAQLNGAMNELFNLLLDGALSSVWGITQIRRDFLEDPDQAADGIPQGECFVVNQNLPPGEKVLERVDEGRVPQDGFAMYQALNSEFAAAALTTELRVGQLSPKEVRATEIVASEQSASALLDGIAGDIERTLFIPLVRKAFLCVLQFMDKVPETDLETVIGQQGLTGLKQFRLMETLGRAMQSGRMDLEAGTRAVFSTLSTSALRVRGLSAVLERSRSFQKFMALMQLVTTNPILLQAYFTEYSPSASLAYAMKLLQIDPSDLSRANREKQSNMAVELQNLPLFQQLLSKRGEGAGGPNNPNMGGPGTGGGIAPAEVNQMVNPMTGMTGQE